MNKFILILSTFFITSLATAATSPVEKCETAAECLDLEKTVYKAVTVTPENFCGEVDPYFIGDSCSYKLAFSDGTLVQAWLIGSDVKAGNYDIKYLPSSGQVSTDFGLGIFKILK